MKKEYPMPESTQAEPLYARSFGYSLAAEVLQSPLYHKLEDRTRAECDELIARGHSAAPSVLPPLQEPVKYDDVLAPFLTLMRRELHANCGKGDRPGWLAMSPNEALLEVYYHLLSKLQKAVKHNDGPAIQEFSADVANMSMMVLDICGGLAWVDDAAPLPVQEDERVQVRMLTSREVANLWRLQPAAEDITDAIQREFCRVNGLTLPAASEGAAP
jgi:hypothetical protein